MTKHECAVCKSPASQCCSNCNTIYYCGREHQKLDWKNGHKGKCVPYKIEFDETLGRHLVATRKIGAGEIIMKKKPIVIGPKIASYPLCLGCNKRIEIGSKFRRCPKCRWPVCGEKCFNTPLHVNECPILAKSADTFPQIRNENAKQVGYCLILPLRALLLKTTNKAQYDLICGMESHLDQTGSSPIYAMYRAKLAPFLKLALNSDVPEAEILHICSVFDTNCFEVRSPDGLVTVRALYPTAFLMSHNCKHNTKHTFLDDDGGFKIVVSATESIEKGQLLTTTYTQTLWGTLARRAHLKKVKFFDCTCSRCKDPTEFGTYAGSIYCSACKLTSDDSVSSPKMISTDPLDPNAMWACEKCDHSITAKQIVWGNESVRKEILDMDKSGPKPLEEFLIKYENLLHPINYHFLEIKYALTQMYGNIDGFKLTGT